MALTDYIFHASTDGQERIHLSYDHILPMGDFGNGIYLSNNEEESLIWGASTDCSTPYMNIYEVSDALYNLQGVELNPYDNADLLFWVGSVAYPRRHRREFQKQEAWREIERIYEKYVAPRINQYDWIVSNRSDDGTNFFLPDFFAGDVDIEAVRNVYLSLSFGSQLVLKTQAAENCIAFVEGYSYDGTQLNGEYYDWIVNNATVYSKDYRSLYAICNEQGGISVYEF